MRHLALSRRAAPAFMLAATGIGLGAIGAGMAEPGAFRWVLVMWVLGSLTLIGWLDGAFYRIDASWLGFLVVSGLLWQMLEAGLDSQEGLERALFGAGLGFAVGAVPIAVAEALGKRWPFFPGDALLFAGMGILVGPWVVLWVLSLGAVVSFGRHAWVQQRRGRSWREGYVALGPGIAVVAGIVFVATNFGLISGMSGPGR